MLQLWVWEWWYGWPNSKEELKRPKGKPNKMDDLYSAKNAKRPAENEKAQKRYRRKEQRNRYTTVPFCRMPATILTMMLSLSTGEYMHEYWCSGDAEAMNCVGCVSTVMEKNSLTKNHTLHTRKQHCSYLSFSSNIFNCSQYNFFYVEDKL